MLEEVEAKLAEQEEDVTHEEEQEDEVKVEEEQEVR